MRAIVTVIGKDQVGIIAGVSTLLASEDVNILDTSQTVLQGYFTMFMLVDLAACRLSFRELADALDKKGQERGLTIRIQRTEIFDAMHRI